MGMRRIAAGLLLGWALGAAAAPQPPPAGPLPDSAEPRRYELHFRIDPSAEGFSATAEIQVALKAPADHLWLHALGLRIQRSELRDAAGQQRPVRLSLQGDSGLARVDFGATLPAQQLTLTFAYSADYNRQLEGLYRTRRAGKPYVITQMEPISARRAFPSFDEPRFKTPFVLRIDLPPGQRALANAAQENVETLADGWQRLSFKATPPLPTYLLALAVGPWDIVDGKTIPSTRWRDQPLPLRAAAPAGEGPRLAEVLQATPAIVTALEDYFGYPYAFGKLDLLAAPDFSAGAMENPGLVIYRESLLLLDANTPALLRQRAFSVNAHELAHQWFGDTVTMPWWDDLWLNEAFATWMAGRITTQLRPEHRADLERIAEAQVAMAADSLASARRVRQPIRDNGDIEGAFDKLTYAKGAAVLGMFEAWLGENVFRDGLRRYMRKHAFASATSDDLIDALAEAGDQGAGLGRAMRSFLDQAGVPLVSTRLVCEGDKALLKLSQQRYLPAGSSGDAQQRWGIPLCVRLGKGAESRTQCQLLEQASGELPLQGGCPDWYLPNAEGRGYYRVALPREELARLTAAAGQLNDREQLAYADIIKAGFERGDVDAAAVLAALKPLSAVPTREVALALQDTVVWIRRNLADADTRAALDRYVAALYLPRLRALGYLRRPGEPERDALLRADLAELLGRKVDNAEVRVALLAQGKAVLAGDGAGRLRFGAANYDLLGTVLAVTVQELGATAVEALVAELARNDNANLRLTMVMALGATTDPTLGERVRDFALSDAVKVSETARLLSIHQYEPRNRAALWAWLQPRFGRLVAHTPVFVHGQLPELLSEGECDAAAAKRVAAFFSRQAGEAAGTAQGMQRAREAILLCAARRAKHGGDSLAAWARQAAL